MITIGVLDAFENMWFKLPDEGVLLVRQNVLNRLLNLYEARGRQECYETLPPSVSRGNHTFVAKGIKHDLPLYLQDESSVPEFHVQIVSG